MGGNWAAVRGWLAGGKGEELIERERSQLQLEVSWKVRLECCTKDNRIKIIRSSVILPRLKIVPFVSRCSNARDCVSL